ncbi:hypothetical protein LOTGIDRAFT_171768 [Lottia gigantea]|uniref:Uncharacterized protein n=1 Tax=Lottia gigantea TaxID=225164 RepID=V4AYJ5_LOTGI|nr:hypothetical protein LOTGIDRAFT_171768 [Lottia gigantea]ESP02693.1 hypothetical protein LOTGIDRAFT_171768 [Lottia gigantea]
MFSLLKKIRGEEEAVPSFKRYFSPRKSWLLDYEDSDTCLTRKLRLETNAVDGCLTVSQELAFGEGAEDHIYEEIGDVVPFSPIESYVNALTVLTQQIETDFGEKSREDDDVSPDEPAPVETLSASSPMTVRCREKCERWLTQLSKVNPTDFVIPEPMTPTDNFDRRPHSSSRIRRRPNIRKMSAEKRKELLQKIEENWFDSSDESSDESYPSLVSQESSGRLTQSSCTEQTIENPSNEQSQWQRSSSEESSGIFEGNSSCNKTGESSGASFENLNSITESDSAFSEIQSKDLPSFRPRIGFGLNRWYRH